MSQTVRIELDDEIFLGLDKNPDELAGEMRLAAAVKWYELGLISQGKAAQMAGMSRAAFIASLAQFGVSACQETAEEIVAAIQGDLACR